VIERIEGKKKKRKCVVVYNIRRRRRTGGRGLAMAAVADCCTQLYYIRDLARVV
jgi:hypothetical protein